MSSATRVDSFKCVLTGRRQGVAEGVGRRSSEREASGAEITRHWRADHRQGRTNQQEAEGPDDSRRCVRLIHMRSASHPVWQSCRASVVCLVRADCAAR